MVRWLRTLLGEKGGWCTMLRITPRSRRTSLKLLITVTVAKVETEARLQRMRQRLARTLSGVHTLTKKRAGGTTSIM